MKIKLNMDISGFKKGEELELLTHNGVPIDAYWRKRLKDSEIDNCIEIIPQKSSSSESKKRQVKNDSCQ